MSDLGRTLAFASTLYRQRAAVAYAGYLKREPLARLALRSGRVDPYAIYEQLRARGPLTPTPLGNWASTSHRVCDTVLRDRRFGVSGGVVSDDKDVFNLSFLEMNPPDHTRLRRLAMPAFSPKAVATYTGRIERVVGDLLATAAAAGRFDLVSAFATPVPVAVISDLLGIPGSASADFARCGATMATALDGVRSLRHAARLRAADARLRTLFEDLFELRRREPKDDIVSQLVMADGDQLKPDELLPMCVLLLVAGFETTVNLIGNGVLALLANPDQWLALRADPETMAPKVVEETLRFDPPVHLTSRMALEPVELEGKAIRAGQLVLTLIGGANRDPQVYDRPATFDITRENPAPHLAFSGGIHYCLGQSLARLEAAIAFRLLAERLPGLHRAGRVKPRNATTIRGPQHLPVAT